MVTALGYGLLLLGVLLAALGSGYDLLYRLAYLLLALLAVAPLWAWASLRGLWATVEREGGPVQVGNYFSERVRVRAPGHFLRSRIQVREPSDLPGHQAGAVVNIPVAGYRSWRVRTLCQRRGYYRLGPLEVASSDPFGLFHFRREVVDPFYLVVYPRQVELPHFALPPAELAGNGRLQRRSLQVTPSAAGLRDYVSGDSLRRIHWPGTARHGKLMVKEFDREPSSDLWLALDLEARWHRGEGEESTEEYAVTIAASLAGKFLRTGYAMGLLIGGRQERRLPPERGGRHLQRVLEALATARADGDTPLAHFLPHHGRHLNRHSAVVVITPSPEADWPQALRQVMERGSRGVAILVDASTFGDAPSPQGLAASLEASGIHTYRVGQGDSLETALAHPLHHAWEPVPWAEVAWR